MIQNTHSAAHLASTPRRPRFLHQGPMGTLQSLRTQALLESGSTPSLAVATEGIALKSLSVEGTAPLVVVPDPDGRVVCLKSQRFPCHSETLGHRVSNDTGVRTEHCRLSGGLVEVVVLESPCPFNGQLFHHRRIYR